MTTTWNGNSLPDPEGWEDTEDYIGSQFHTTDGTFRQDTITSYRRIRLRWTNVTLAQAGDIRTEAVGTSDTTLDLPDGSSYTVTPIRGSYRKSTVGGNSSAYDVECEVRAS